MKKPKKCRHCKGDIINPRSSTQAACSPQCAIRLVETKRQKETAKMLKARERAYKAQRKQRKEALLTLGDHHRLTQAAFNAYIRARDVEKGCISCGASLIGVKFDAGHWKSRGHSPELRYSEDNVHGQCVRCNQHLSGAVDRFREGLLERIGQERVEALETFRPLPRYRVEDLKEIRATYKAKLKEIVNNSDA